MEVGESPEHSGRGFRQRKSKANPMCCPICGVTLRANEIDHHFAVEVDRLERILKPKKQTAYGGAGEDATYPSTSYSNGEGPSHASSNPSVSHSNGHGSEEATRIVGPEECWGTYQKIKNNRQARLKMKSRKRKPEDNICPICNKATLDDITLHVEACLRKSESVRNGTRTTGNHGSGDDDDDDDDDDDASIDVEGESFDTYEWAGQKRTRVTSLLGAGAHASLGVRITNADDTDDELNVDGDESQVYGPPQYSVRDVVVSGDSKSSETLRELVIGNEPPTVKRPADDNPGEGTSKLQTAPFPAVRPPLDEAMDEPLRPGVEPTESRVVESLKAKIREYEGYFRNRPKCLICMDDFRKPVVSVCCWHVYCEECWLHTLGAKKLCPQCSMITSPIDLRRIYL
ncbi:E3 ubiquitin-protein ligase RNF220 [Anopheles ziemanni]|uniref:E3 ubiquitin-protein ligase RNF220 n=1 Tax=Anopheles ziemanni TaxID=345580 RepID=UPI00265B6E48|nr:E3 ubiquitin-protein ligase RNF220 isoform X2 [Anopheles coustani]XP_058172531.1 E3 ubiquitin-protein ligase RNF220 [Anopheles ziemanni]